MPLFWLVHEIDGERRVFIQEAGAPMTARIKASKPGSTATTRRGACRAKKVPKKMIGRVLTAREVRELLDRMS